MFCSASSSSKRHVYGSARLHPYSQQLLVNPPRSIMQPIPTRAAVHRVLGHRSYSKSKSKSPCPYRRRYSTSEMSALNVDGTYDDDVRDVPMQSIELISSTETGYTQYQHIKREDTPYPNGNLIRTIADLKEESLDTDNSRPVRKYHSFDLALPLPIQWTGYDDTNRGQQEHLDHRPIEYLVLADIGTAQPREQLHSLLYPRVCIGSDANIVDRFVTDCDKSSGRVYDRLFRREMPRIVPYAGDHVRRPIISQVFDVYTGEIRKRCMFDDLRDANARTEGPLEIIEEERYLDYDEVPDFVPPSARKPALLRRTNMVLYDYDADRY